MLKTWHKISSELNKYSSNKLSTELQLKLFGFFKIPLIFLVSPKILSIDDKACRIRIPLNRITSNHHKSMYFGALAIGADLAGAIMAFPALQKHGIHFLFKEVEAQFLKRVECDAEFVCNQGQEIANAIQETLSTKKRVNVPLDINVYAPQKLANEIVAHFKLTLSLKAK